MGEKLPLERSPTKPIIRDQIFFGFVFYFFRCWIDVTWPESRISIFVCEIRLIVQYEFMFAKFFQQTASRRMNDFLLGFSSIRGQNSLAAAFDIDLLFDRFGNMWMITFKFFDSLSRWNATMVVHHFCHSTWYSFRSWFLLSYPIRFFFLLANPFTNL